MIPLKHVKSIIIWMTLVFLFSACTSDTDESHDSEINLWLKADPAKLNPMVYPSSKAREVFQYIMVSLAEFHPETLELTPILIKSIPKPIPITDGPYTGGLSYNFEFLEEATWDDGKPITAHDYLFTLKAIKNPLVQAAGWRPFFKDVKAVNIDPQNPKKFEVIYGKPYMLAIEALVTANLFPAHIYDAHDAMKAITIKALNDENAKSQVEADSAMVRFSKEMNSAKFTRENVVGAGPYQLSQWETDQFLLLEKKKNYWGDTFKNNPFLQGNAEKLIFKIIKDENAAVGLLKTGGLDLIPNLSSENYMDLKNTEGNKFSFFTPQLIVYYYLLINNTDPIMSQISVRKALAQLTDVDQMIANLENGMATRQVGHIHSTKTYYNKSLKPVAYNIEQAAAILEADGWIDTDKDGIRDKMVNGKRTPLVIEFLISKRPLGRRVSLMVQEAAQKVGMKVNLETQSNGIISDRLKKKEYQVNTAALFQDAAPDDPYSKWHGQSPSNYCGINDAELNKLIDQIRLEVDPAMRLPIYTRIQEIIYDAQPVIFLYSPKSRIISSDRINATATPKRPGYLANTFTFKK